MKTKLLKKWRQEAMNRIGVLEDEAKGTFPPEGLSFSVKPEKSGMRSITAQSKDISNYV